MNYIDTLIQNYFSVSRTPFVTAVMSTLSAFFDVTDLYSTLRFAILILAVSALIYLLKGKKYSFLFLITVFLAGLIVLVLKYIFNTTRPDLAIITLSTPSFPSYHATQATVFFAMLIYVFSRDFSEFGRIIFNSFCVFGIILVSVSRVYLGVHWFSDVFGGIVLGLFIIYLSIWLFKFLYKK